MDQQIDAVIRNDFRGGVNDKLFATLIGENQLVYMQNVDHATAGQVITIPGHTQIANTPLTANGRLRGLFTFVDSTGVEFLCGVDNQATQHLWTIKSGDLTWTDRGAITGFNAQLEVFAAQAKDRIFFVDGSHLMVSWDGTAMRQSTSNTDDPPTGLKGLAWFQGRMFGFKGGDLYFSDALFPFRAEAAGTFSGGWDQAFQYLKIAPGTGQSIVHIEVLRGEELIVFLDKSIWRVVVPTQNIFGVTTFGLPVAAIPLPSPISTTIGCGARNSVATIGGDMIFMDQRGQVRSLRRTLTDESQGVNPIPLSDPIRGTINQLNQIFRAKSAAIVDDNKYHISVPGLNQSDVSQTLDFDITLQSWNSPHTWSATRFIRSTYTGIEKIYFSKADADNFKVYELNSGTSFAGSAISAIVRTRREDHGKPWAQKIARWAEFYFLTGALTTATINVAIDGGSFSQLAQLDLSGGAGTLPQVLPFFLGGEGVLRTRKRLTDVGPYFDIQFEITQGEVDKPMTFLGYSIFSELRDPRRSD